MNNSRILKIKNAKLSGYYFYMNLNICGDFQICIGVPLIVYIEKEDVGVAKHQKKIWIKTTNTSKKSLNPTLKTKEKGGS